MLTPAEHKEVVEVVLLKDVAMNKRCHILPSILWV